MKPEANGQCKHRLEWRRRDGRNRGDGRGGGLKLKTRSLSSVSLDPLHPAHHKEKEKKKKKGVTASHHTKTQSLHKTLTDVLPSVRKSLPGPP